MFWDESAFLWSYSGSEIALPLKYSLLSDTSPWYQVVFKIPRLKKPSVFNVSAPTGIYTKMDLQISLKLYSPAQAGP